ncbi:transcription-repair coupling factor [Candidatus Paracaedibacter symbiosus]|uniref:transcription-repair coupling factor n=1 Tax=Candidatus Paracaedibacter symbiosus TaxID=244582 RepID=UPI000509FB8C|nr:transcription-repair coupling factor [Candidatus Paracaedibacter symbiosus]
MNNNNLLTGVADGFEPFIIQQWWLTQKRNIVFLAHTEEKAERAYAQLKLLMPAAEILFFPAWDCLPYDRVSPSSDVVTTRLLTLQTLISASTKPAIVVTSVNAFLQKLPPKQALQQQSMTLAVGESLNRDNFINFLMEKGYHRSDTVRDIAEFAVRGDIIDLFPIGVEAPIRIDLFDDEIERLRYFNPASQTTIGTTERIQLQPVSEVVLTPASISNFRTAYRELLGTKFGGLRGTEPKNIPLYEAISGGRRYAGMEHWLPLFFEETQTLLDYIDTPDLLVDFHAADAVHRRLELVQDYYLARAHTIPGDKSPGYHPVPPEYLYLTAADWEEYLKQPTTYQTTPFSEARGLDYGCRVAPDFTAARQQGKVFDELQQLLHNRHHKQIILSSLTDGSRDRFHNLLAEHELDLFEPLESWPTPEVATSLITFPMEKGFETPEFLLLTEQDLFGEKLVRVQKAKKARKFLLETTDLSSGDLVVHQDHGIGRYQGLQTIEINGALHDCLCLMYEGNDKLFLPVENIEVVSRYGSDDSIAQLDKLGSAAWQNRKARVKKRIREIADYLIKLAAERSLREGVLLEASANDYDRFCARFPYPETDDQLRAIEETLNDMTSGKPMDRLVCGDVGFGKTEVALRAAFVAAAAGKQVAIVTPTTLLCRQHFKTFKERFEDFPIRIEQLSRFVPAKQASQIRADLAEGKVDIVIATHTLFSEKIKFAGLGLLIIDEEQHFGVKQKEKLKSLQKDVHVLTLTATPIPRTLQLALTGVREMSLIATPPVDRHAVRTFVMPYDGLTLREAILREYYRGGQIFYVCPRLEELNKLYLELKQLVPEIKIVMAHGQMPATQLENVMTEFYDRHYHLLLSTNIVESGIDIATANTLIIHRADLFGLAQLYQLRGRVGRSNIQGYAYLTLPPTQQLSSNAQKRLEIMQTLDKLGSGFTLASHDMDIRGTGNIVGEEQSGHIREVGVELYQSLLQEAIMMVRAEQENLVPLDLEWSPQINVGTSVMIPEAYVADLNLRLNLYRRIAGLETRAEIDAFASEMIDRFGKLPQEVKNLFEIIEIKSLCRKARIEKLDVGPKGVLIAFRDNTFPNPTGLLSYLSNPKMAAKLRPDHKVFFAREWPSTEQRAKSTKMICANLAKLIDS